MLERLEASRHATAAHPPDRGHEPFDAYVCEWAELGGTHGLVRVVGRWRIGLPLSRAPELVVTTGRRQCFAAMPGSPADSHPWRAGFAVGRDLLADRAARFSLVLADGSTVALETPVKRSLPGGSGDALELAVSHGRERDDRHAEIAHDRSAARALAAEQRAERLQARVDELSAELDRVRRAGDAEREALTERVALGETELARARVDAEQARRAGEAHERRAEAAMVETAALVESAKRARHDRMTKRRLAAEARAREVPRKGADRKTGRPPETAAQVRPSRQSSPASRAFAGAVPAPLAYWTGMIVGIALAVIALVLAF